MAIFGTLLAASSLELSMLISFNHHYKITFIITGFESTKKCEHAGVKISIIFSL